MNYKTFLGILLVFPFTTFGMEPDPASVDSPLNAAGETPLMRAITYGDKDKVQKLIKAGANINFVTKYGMTPHALATIGSMFSPEAQAILKLLEEHGAHGGPMPLKITVGSKTKESK